MERFLACHNLVKNPIFQNPFTVLEITLLGICHSNLSVRCLVRGEIFLLKARPFLAWQHNMERFGHFVPGSRSFLQHFLGSKSSKKDKNMMSCNRLYVEPTEAVIDQARKRRLLSLLMEW